METYTLRAVFVLLLIVAPYGFVTNMPAAPYLTINYTEKDFKLSNLSNVAWERAVPVTVDAYWSGKAAPNGRHFTAKLLWSDTALYVRFEAVQKEPIVVSENPDTTGKTWQLWDRDVCEIFIAPDRKKPTRYFEFEVAPTGEWIDLAIEVLPDRRVTDRDYLSGMETAAKIEPGKIVMGMKIPWKAFGKVPKPGDAWLGNIFRCVGKDPDRGYLAWQPTLTEKPNFHLPKAFGKFMFVN